MRFAKSIGLCLLLIVSAFVPVAAVQAARRPFTVIVDGEPLDEALSKRIASFQVDQRLDAPDYFTMSITGSKHGLPPGADGDLFTVGKELQVSGQGGSSESALFSGEITSVEFEIGAKGRPILVVSGFDRLHRLTRGRRTRVWEAMSDSDIASAVVAQYGLSAELGAALPSSGYVFQRNESDLEFLQRRAARIGFAVWVEDTKLYFQPSRSPDDPADVTLSGGFRSVHLKAEATVKKVTVRGWDPEKKVEIVGEVTAVGSRLGGQNIVLDYADAASETSPLAEGLVFSQAEADALAAAAFRDALGDSSHGDIEIDGDPALHPRLLVELSGVGARFNGKYFVVGTTHRFQKGKPGYTTTVSVRRAAE